MKIYRLVNTKNNCTLGIFSTKEKALDAFYELKENVGIINMIIFEGEIDRIYTENC